MGDQTQDPTLRTYSQSSLPSLSSFPLFLFYFLSTIEILHSQVSRNFVLLSLFRFMAFLQVLAFQSVSLKMLLCICAETCFSTACLLRGRRKDFARQHFHKHTHTKCLRNHQLLVVYGEPFNNRWLFTQQEVVGSYNKAWLVIGEPTTGHHFRKTIDWQSSLC